MFRHQLIAALIIAGLTGASAYASDEPSDDAPEKHEAKTELKSNPAKKIAKGKANSAQEKAFRAVQRGVLSQMKNKNEDKRVEAFEKLKEFPTVDCAKLLVQQGMSSPFEDVRKQAYATLASFRDSDEVCQFLLTTVEKETTRGTATETTCALFAVPLSSDSPDIEKKAFDLFEKAANQKKGGLLLLVTMIDQLGTQSEGAGLAALTKITKRPIFNEQFGIRRSVVQALSKIEEKEAVDELVTIFGNVQGEVRGDIVQHLTAISGEKFGLDPAAWDTWWKAKRDKFVFPAAGAREVNKAEAVGARSMYYGLPIYAAKLVFIIDTSGSMHHGTSRGTRIELAKRELINAINGLPEGVYFDVVAFDRQVYPWQRQLAVASSENKKKASMWVMSRNLGGATASYDALETALDLDAEAIYFLTDGAPHGGKVVNPIEIVEVISRLNFTRRETIHAIGIDVGPALPTNPFHFFLNTLAERNYGEYRAVNE